MMVTEVSVEYEVHFAVVVLDNPYRSCRLQLLVVLVTQLIIVILIGSDRFCCLWPSLDFVNNY